MIDTESILAAAADHLQRGRAADARAALEGALRLDPDNARVLRELGIMLIRTARAGDAVPLLRRAVGLRPDDADLCGLLGEALRDAGRLNEALDAARRTVELEPDNALNHNKVAVLLSDQGRTNEAIDSYRRALALQPRAPLVHSNLLLSLNYLDSVPPREMRAEHRAFGQTYEPATPVVMPPRAPAGDGRLRIGYLSPDLKHHSVSFFIWPILANHDRSRVHVTCYADVDHPDAVTQRLHALPEQWRQVFGLADGDVARLIEQDQIDVLVDLAGHTMHNRLPLLARRVAPVQVTYLGYPNTTGLLAMDYRLTDSVADPPGMTESHYVERLVRLPDTFCACLDLAGGPDVSPLPAWSNGHVTFAVSTNFSKVRPAGMKLWAEILLGVPGSRLMIRSRSTNDPATCDAVARAFADHGVSADRLDLRGWLASFPEYVAVLGAVDVILDTFPYNGHTSSYQAMFNGVPVVTLAGDTFRSRVGASLLSTVGLPELIADSEAAYVRIATGLGRDLDGLSAMRATLRERLRRSPLFDAARFTRHLELAYQTMARSGG